MQKVDVGDKSKRLAGARFYLADSKQNAENENFLTREIDTSGTREEVSVTTDQNGQASIRAIGAGTYYLVETQAPTGYHKLTEPIEVTVSNDPRNNITNLEISNTQDGTLGTPGDQPNEPGNQQGNNNSPGSGDSSGGKGVAGGVKTGDIVRMTGIFLLVIASVGVVIVIIRKEKQEVEIQEIQEMKASDAGINV